jgi:hypothetical protein
MKKRKRRKEEQGPQVKKKNLHNEKIKIIRVWDIILSAGSTFIWAVDD